jgi:hypothetical protein
VLPDIPQFVAVHVGHGMCPTYRLRVLLTRQSDISTKQ